MGKLWEVLFALLVYQYRLFFILMDAWRDLGFGSYPYSTGIQNSAESLNVDSPSRKKKEKNANLSINVSRVISSTVKM